MSERTRAEASATALHELLDRHLHSKEERLEIEELRAAGVSASRLSALYPGNLLDLAPRLEVLMRQSPIPPEAVNLDVALVELNTRSWIFMTLPPDHPHQLFDLAFYPERTGYVQIGNRTLAVVESMSLRLLLALIITVSSRDFAQLEQETPWAEIDTFFTRAQQVVRLADEVLISSS